MTDGRRSLVAAALRETCRAFVGVAALSAVTNLLMLTAPLFMMQVYDRVLASRSVPTLVALSILVIGLYLFLGLLEGWKSSARVSSPRSASGWRRSRAARPSIPAVRPRPGSAIHERQGPISVTCRVCRSISPFCSCFMFHAYLGWLAVAGAVILIALTLLRELTLRQPMQRLAQLGSSRAEFIEAGGAMPRRCMPWG
ncbi:hypothetical protein [Sinorhizobium meliloti]|uniref:hypothetical protein n=1 Tax=Rhizobium meliloti TaxID=382 RepID=UPI001F30B440|nr:hypothetical protein [Sinorhizobium meliloti]